MGKGDKTDGKEVKLLNKKEEKRLRKLRVSVSVPSTPDPDLPPSRVSFFPFF